MICVATMHLKIQKKKIWIQKHTKTKNIFLPSPATPTPSKYMCWGSGNLNNCISAPRQPNTAGFWVSGSSPFPPEPVPEMNLCIQEQLVEGCEHQKALEWLFIQTGAKTVLFPVGKTLEASFLGRCFWPCSFGSGATVAFHPALERRGGHLPKPEPLCRWGTCGVCSFLSFAWGSPK